MSLDPNLQAVGRAVRRAREAAEISQESLAADADLHRNFVGLIERGERAPGLITLLKFAAILGVHPAEFFSDPHFDQFKKPGT